jgi:hypothetical protein
MRLRNLPILAAFFLASSTSMAAGDAGDVDGVIRYSRADVRAELTYLYDTLQAVSYDLYRVTAKPEFDEAYKDLYESISEPLTALDINRRFQPFIALAGLSHCKIEFPSEAYRHWYEGGGMFFPLDIAYSNNRAIVVANWSDNTEISSGDQILAINGINFPDVLQDLYPMISGENDYAKRTSLEAGSFADTWWYVHGNFEGGIVRWQGAAGDVSETYVPGYSIVDYRRKSPSMELPQFTKDDREFRFIDDVAYLRPGLFLNLESSNISKHEAFENGEFLHFLDSAFGEIAAKRPASLIIDIRGNNGGDNSFSDPMIAYFADRPFRMTSRFSVRTSELTKTFWQDVDIESLAKLKEQIMSLPNGTRFEADLGEALPRNDEFSFKGPVYVLVDRFSFSNAAVAAAIVQDYGFGILIGEETSYVPSSCGAIHTFALPYTGQTVIYSKACSVRPNGDTAMRGVIPDILIHDDLSTEADEILEKALELSRNGQ